MCVNGPNLGVRPLLLLRRAGFAHHWKCKQHCWSGTSVPSIPTAVVAFPPCWEVAGSGHPVLDYRNQGVMQTVIGAVIDGQGGKPRNMLTIGSTDVPMDLIREVSVDECFCYIFLWPPYARREPPYQEGILLTMRTSPLTMTF